MGSPAKFKVGDVVQFAYTLRETEAGKINNVFSDAYTATIREVRENKSLGSWEYLLTYAPGVKGFLTDFFWHEWFLRSMDEAEAEKKKQIEEENKVNKLQKFNIGDRVFYAYDVTLDENSSPQRRIPVFHKDFLGRVKEVDHRERQAFYGSESGTMYKICNSAGEPINNPYHGVPWWEEWMLKAAPSLQAVAEEEKRMERIKADKIAADREKALLESIPKIAQSLQNIEYILQDILEFKKNGGG